TASSRALAEISTDATAAGALGPGLLLGGGVVGVGESLPQADRARHRAPRPTKRVVENVRDMGRISELSEVVSIQLRPILFGRPHLPMNTRSTRSTLHQLTDALALSASGRRRRRPLRRRPR